MLIVDGDNGKEQHYFDNEYVSFVLQDKIVHYIRLLPIPKCFKDRLLLLQQELINLEK